MADPDEIQTFADTAGLTPTQTAELQRLVGRRGLSALSTVIGDLEPVLLAPGSQPPAQVHTTHPTPMEDMLDRYEDMGLLGRGAMGEVRRVRDRDLNRVLAMKTMHEGVLGRPRTLARFVEEAQATAQLQHPNIVPVYDFGVLPDGRCWFTMMEVRGRPLAAIIDEVHAASGDRWLPAESGWNFRRLMAAFLQVCQAVAYAHARGVVHRDLKPDNAMVGNHGEVYVVDWGLAKILGRPDRTVDERVDPIVVTHRSALGSKETRVGTISGTPAYMSPEQARGDVNQVDARSDVFGLGAILYEILTGRVPYPGNDLVEVLARAATGSYHPIRAHPSRPPELVALCHRAMQAETADRFPNAVALADEVQAWLDGVRRRDQALEIVAEAADHDAGAHRLREEASVLEERGQTHLAAVPSEAGEQEKAPGWADLDRAAALRREAELASLKAEQELHGALRIDPELTEGHVGLADRYLAEHQQAEAQRDRDAADRARVLLQLHSEALPADHPERARHQTYLAGTGALTLHTDPPGAEVALFRYVERNRRLVAEPVGHLGRTPLDAVPVEMGSYLCRITHPGRATVDYPVQIRRLEHWDGRPPGADAPHPIPLPDEAELEPDDCYVPAGWFQLGGDPVAADSLPAMRVWCDALVVKRFGVTNRQYIAFLDDLVRQGREEEALRYAPREQAGSPHELGALIYGRRADGGFALRADGQGDMWEPDWPVCMVPFASANAYARWLGDQTGQPWRLATEIEWEKAARGVDGRWAPWGDFVDPAWCAMRGSAAGRLPAVVDSFPVDCSVYGIRGLGGNMREWCGGQPRPLEGLVDPELRGIPGERPDPAALDPAQRRSFRGGNWFSNPNTIRCAVRYDAGATYRPTSLGMRVARSYHRPSTMIDSPSG